MSIQLYYDKLMRLTQTNKRLPRLIALLILLLILWLLYDTAQMVIKPLELLPQLKLQQNIKVNLAAPIAQQHLFGVYSASLAGLPETRLQVTLQGTEVSLYSDRQSHAIISAPGQQTKSYAVGSQIPGGATITKIEWNRVILNHNGHLEQLRMPLPKLKYSSPQGLHLKTVE